MGLLLVGVGLMSFHQPPVPPTDCKQQLLAAYHRLTGTDKSGHSGVYHLQFVSTSRYRAPDKRQRQETTVHGELYYQGNRFYFETEQLRLWQDERYVATVLPAQRTVLVTRVAPGRHLTTPSRLLGVRDSLLLVGTLQQCKQDKQARQFIRLGYSGSAGAQLRVQALEFRLLSHKLEQVRLSYRPEGPVEETLLRFPVQEWLTSSPKLPIDARQQVLSPQGKLLPAFQGYRLVNQIPPGH